MLSNALDITPNKQLFVKRHIQTFLTKWQQNDSMQIDNDLRASFFSTYSDLEESLQGKGNMDYVEMLGLINKINTYKNYSLSNLTDLYNHLCVTGSVYRQVGDLIFMDNCTIAAANAILKDCRNDRSRYTYFFTEELWDPYEFAVASAFENKIFTDKRSIFRNTFRLRIDKGLAYGLFLFLEVYFLLYVSLDIYSRLAILVRQIADDVTVRNIFSTSLPGCNVKGQCKVFCGFGYVLLSMYYYRQIFTFFEGLGEERSYLKDEVLTYDRSTYDNTRTNFYTGVILVFMVFCRVVLHLNSLRLLPYIGGFVITTFAMAADLFKFTIIYLLINVFFSYVIHIVSGSTDCPIFKEVNNNHYLDSMFFMFAVTFGHVDIEFTNAAIKTIYIVYVIVSVVLLLNLIIAVMSSTATVVTTKPWRSQLSRQVLMSEALGIEHWLLLMCFYCDKIIHWSLRRVGFTVTCVKKTNHVKENQVDVLPDLELTVVENKKQSQKMDELQLTRGKENLMKVEIEYFEQVKSVTEKKHRKSKKQKKKSKETE